MQPVARSKRKESSSSTSSSSSRSHSSSHGEKQQQQHPHSPQQHLQSPQSPILSDLRAGIDSCGSNETTNANNLSARTRSPNHPTGSIVILQRGGLPNGGPNDSINPIRARKSINLPVYKHVGIYPQNNSKDSSSTGSTISRSGTISQEQLEFGPLLKSGEVQVIYRSPESDSTCPLDRHLKEEQAKQVAPNLKQSPIAIMTMNPTYELQNKPLTIEYPAIVENLRLNNTGFSWEVKLPYQISMTTALYGAHLNTTYRYRLDQFHCHWGERNNHGSEHTVDNHFYSAEMHFVHYNMEKYHTFSKAARHSDGLVVLSVFIDASEDHHNHAELEKIVAHLKSVQLKGERSIIRQAIRIENLLPTNRSYWSYQGSLTTPPYFESVTWFILKQPIRCSQAQIQRFRGLKSSLKHDDGVFITSNHRRVQPLNGRTIVNYDESTSANSMSHNHSPSSGARFRN